MKKISAIVGCGLLALLPCVLVGQDKPAASLKQELKSCPFKILFEAYQNDNWDIHIMNADGSGRKNLTNTPDLHEHYPQASPDGTKICFLCDKGDGDKTVRGVYVMNADGTGRKCVAEKGRDPCWSPDGTKIAYARHEFDRFRVTDFASKGINIYDLRTGKSEPIANSDKVEHLYNLCWSADGKWIISTVHAGMGFKHGIVAIEIEGTRIIDMKLPGCRPSLGADGKLIANSFDDYCIGLADLDFSSGAPKATNPRRLVAGKPSHYYHPDISPDGKYVAYSVSPTGGKMKVSGPGTFADVAEMIGVKGPWNIYVCRTTAAGKPEDAEQVQLTDDLTLSSKEPEWIVAH